MSDPDRKPRYLLFFAVMGSGIIIYILHIILGINFIPAAFWVDSPVPKVAAALSYAVILAVQLAVSMIIFILIVLRQVMSRLGLWKGQVLEKWYLVRVSMLMFGFAVLALIMSAVMVFDRGPNSGLFRFYLMTFGAFFCASCFSATCIVGLMYPGDVNHNTRVIKPPKYLE